MPPLLPPFLPAALALADGTVFRGVSIGALGQSVGEVVFNTALTGYQEILTDPSYCGQMVTLTTPHIGNVGINPEDGESAKPFAAGLIVRDVPKVYSNFRATQSLSDYLRAQNIVGISDIDTRALTRRLRDHGAQNGCLIAAETLDANAIQQALHAAQAAPSMAGLDLAKLVSTKQVYAWNEGAWSLGHGFNAPQTAQFHVVVYDFGVKHNILRLLVERGARLTVMPAQTPAAEVLALAPDGVFLSNGPGDPAPCTYAIEAIRALLAARVPLFGICLGHQLLALAAGAQTLKMKFGHHGSNHPVKNLATGQVHITAQNHGFAVDPRSLPPIVAATHVSLFDGSLQGLRLTDHPAFGFQGHPEASPGPHDIDGLFDDFAALMRARRNA